MLIRFKKQFKYEHGTILSGEVVRWDGRTKSVRDLVKEGIAEAINPDGSLAKPETKPEARKG